LFQIRSATGHDDYHISAPQCADSDSFHSSSIFHDEELVDHYLNHPDISVEHPLPIDYATIEARQQGDPALVARLQSHPQQFQLQHFPTENPRHHLICYRRRPELPWRIRIPDDLLAWTVNWYHLSLNHLGSSRLRDTISLHMTHPELRLFCEQAVSACRPCQQSKIQHRQYGELPPREVRGNPWADIAVDLIGPWNVPLHGQNLVFQALTIIDTVTNYCELIRINNKTARHVGIQLENAWLSRYPRPVRCLFDQGGEFIGNDFIRVLRNHGIKPVALTAKNPQANALCERLHLTVANVLRSLVHFNPPQNIDNAALTVDTALQTAAYSTRVAMHGALKHSPGSLAFHRDMLFDIPLLADMEVIRQRRQHIVDERARLANRN
jgi:transposase InsO family protein